MKMKLNLFFYDWNDWKDRELQAETSTFSADHKILVRDVVVEIPDGIDFTETEYQEAQYLKNLSLAERKVREKRQELHIAEEVVKNMLALPGEVVR